MKRERLARLESVLRETLAVMIRDEIKDPRVQNLTLTRAELSGDGKVFTAWISPLGGPGLAASPSHYEAQIRSSLKGLESAAPFLRRETSKVLGLKFTPEIRFREDKGLANADRIQELLQTISERKTSS